VTIQRNSTCAEIPCHLAITPSRSGEGSWRKLSDFASLGLRYAHRFSQPLGALTSSDASLAFFSQVALVGFAPFRGFSSLVADVAESTNRVRLPLSSSSALLVRSADTNPPFLRRATGNQLHTKRYETRLAL
jgi:hypothetical protein